MVPSFASVSPNTWVSLPFRADGVEAAGVGCLVASLERLLLLVDCLLLANRLLR